MMELSLESKWNHLREILHPLERVVVAFSGGVDSTTLLRAATEVLGAKNVLAATSTSASVPEREVEETKTLAAQIGVRHLLIKTEELSDPQYARNDANRCYFCKHTLFSDLVAIARREGFSCAIYGAILDDLGDFRPGMRAARELGIRGPLAEAQFAKGDVRALAQHFDLQVWSKPASACLSSRVAHGIEITTRVLSQVERAENFLRDLGFRQVRVRHHGNLARIEVDAGEIERAAARAPEIASFLKGVGYQYVSLDLNGYRTGSVSSAATAATS